MPDGLNPRSTPALPMPVALLARWFQECLGVADASIVRTDLLPGGAVQHNWLVGLNVEGAPHSYVLRTGPAVSLPESLPKAKEFDILRCVFAQGIPAPEPLWFRDGAAPFFVSRLCRGDARREGLIGQPDSASLLGDLGSALARIHQVETAGPADPDTPSARVEMLTEWMDGLAGTPLRLAGGISSGLVWLRTNVPDNAPTTLVHRDFRTGNFLVEDGRLVAVVDWEFAGWGDPHEDIGWFCAQCWRGDSPDREAGGLGDRAAFYEAYRAAGGQEPDPDRVRFWEVFAHVRWAIIALQQGARARAGAYPAWELEEAEARVPGLLRTIVEMTR
ncbi:MAG: phosphotransferase family protein [Rhodospirillaceae bacterium]|mgnify:CR=1 FL=1|nr:phosphotransferase family protein [Rhodospirillaceae bacterium]MBT3809445.1 phosphotransferase family protein [Rhodospirillaceae bacterium]MBT3931372.1 phosphotransferase family protein [Rhodospirillaceae bacterium]MBT4772462.1 phosphotransferase family protein [Rhodospirillaceae bacterium]MBT5358944.1 phosphotransferase family protein [Rhodospirillaceae bacterium]